MSVLGERLRLAREKRRLSQRELAELANISPKMIYRYEVENADPSAAILKKLAQILSVSMDYLVGLVAMPIDTLQDEKLTEEEYRLVQSYRQGDIATLMVIGSERLRQLSTSTNNEL